MAVRLNAQVAQSVEHVLGKDEVGGSIPLLGFLSRAGARERVKNVRGKTRFGRKGLAAARRRIR